MKFVRLDVAIATGCAVFACGSIGGLFFGSWAGRRDGITEVQSKCLKTECERAGGWVGMNGNCLKAVEIDASTGWRP